MRKRDQSVRAASTMTIFRLSMTTGAARSRKPKCPCVGDVASRSASTTISTSTRPQEVILLVAAKIKQWVNREMRVLGAGDSALIPADVVHASLMLATATPITVTVHQSDRLTLAKVAG